MKAVEIDPKDLVFEDEAPKKAPKASTKKALKAVQVDPKDLVFEDELKQPADNQGLPPVALEGSEPGANQALQEPAGPQRKGASELAPELIGQILAGGSPLAAAGRAVGSMALPEETIAALRGFTEGATFGNAARLAGALPGGTEREFRDLHKYSQEVAPKSYAIGETVGAMAPSIATGLGGLGKQLLSSAAGRIGFSGLQGAIAGASEGENVPASDRLKQALLSGVLGAGVSGAFEGVGQLAGKAAEKLGAKKLLMGEKVDEAAAQKLASEMQSAGSALSGPQKAINYFKESAKNALANPLLSQEEKDSLQKILQSPKFLEQEKRAVGNLLRSYSYLDSTQEAAESAFQAAKQANTAEGAAQLAERMKNTGLTDAVGTLARRYGSRVLPAAIGGTVGTAVSALTGADPTALSLGTAAIVGAGLGHAGTAIRNAWRKPHVQYGITKRLESAMQLGGGINAKLRPIAEAAMRSPLAGAAAAWLAGEQDPEVREALNKSAKEIDRVDF